MGQCTSTCRQQNQLGKYKRMSKAMRSHSNSKRSSLLLTSPRRSTLRSAKSFEKDQDTRKKTVSQAQMKKQIDFVFNFYDKDGDGSLSLLQFRKMLNTICERKTGQQNRFSQGEAFAIMRNADSGGSMSMSRQDFYNFYKNK